MNNFDNKRDEQQRRVLAFAADMIDRLNEKADDPGKGFLAWELDEVNETFVHLVEEVGEVARAMRDPESGMEFVECVDVACMAFILGDLIVQETAQE